MHTVQYSVYVELMIPEKNRRIEPAHGQTLFQISWGIIVFLLFASVLAAAAFSIASTCLLIVL